MTIFKGQFRKGSAFRNQHLFKDRNGPDDLFGIKPRVVYDDRPGILYGVYFFVAGKHGKVDPVGVSGGDDLLIGHFGIQAQKEVSARIGLLDPRDL